MEYTTQVDSRETDLPADARMKYDAAPRRRASIMQLLRAQGHVSVKSLSEELAVSDMTVRRDLKQLAGAGELVLVHGGASLPPGVSTNPAFSTRALAHSEAKKSIGRIASKLVGDADTVGIDAGTTALEVARGLPESFGGGVVTHSVPVLASMLGRPKVRVFAIGGELFHDNQALIGPSAAESVSNLRLRYLMLGVSAIDANGVYVRSELELEVKRALIDAADEVVLVCDSSKQQASGTVRVCDLSRIDTFISEVPPNGAVGEGLRRAGTRIISAS